MVKKLVDIKSKKKTTKNRIWNKKHEPDTKLEKAIPLLISLVVIFLLFNLIYVFNQGKQLGKSIVDLSTAGYQELENAKTSILNSDWQSASQAFLKAEQSFTELANNADLIEQSVTAPSHLAEAGESLSQTGQILSQLAPKLTDLPKQIIQSNSNLQANPELNIFDESITKTIQSYVPQITEANQNLLNAITNLEKIPKNLIPKDIQPKFESGLSELKTISEKLQIAENNIPLIMDLLGHETPHRYLVLLQNNYEIRGTGGFLGGLIFAEMSQGYLNTFEYHDIYDFDGQFAEPLELPPEFAGVYDELFIRDANFNPDFNESAALIENLLQRAGAQSFDTIFAIDNSVIKDALKITGPVPFQSHQITADTYDVVLTYFEELDTDNTGIASDFVSNFKQKLFANTNFQKLSQVALNNIQSRHIQFYSKDQALQKLLQDFNLTSTIAQTDSAEDYLMLVTAAVGGNKSDKYISQRAIHTTRITEDKELVNTVKIRRFHGFTDAEEYKWQNILEPFGIDQLKDEVRYTLGRGDNRARIKVYVPLGSELQSTKGIEFSRIKAIDDLKANKTYFLIESKVSPGQLEEIELTYKLPFNLQQKPVDLYTLFVQKQSGDDSTIFEKHFDIQSKQRVKHFSPADYDLEKGGFYSYKKSLMQDIRLSVVLSR